MLRRVGTLATALLITLSCAAQQAPDPAEVFRQIGQRLLADLERMPRYTCIQTVTRTYYVMQEGHLSCSSLIAAHQARKRPLHTVGWDRLRMEVALIRGTSAYSWVGARRFSDDTLDKLAGKGPLGSGDFGVFLRDILTRASLTFVREEAADGHHLFEYSYDMPLEKSTYQVNTSLGWVRTAYSGKLVLDADANDIAGLTVRTSELPPEGVACEATSEVTYGRTSIHDRMILVPRETLLYAINRAGDESLSQTTFEKCREFSSTVKLFSDAAQAPGTPSAAADVEPLPAGLHFEARITTPINSETSAAGDPIEAVLRSPIRGKDKVVIAPAGSRIHGRLRNLKWSTEPEDHFQVTVQFESIEIGGKEVPLAAKRASYGPVMVMGASRYRMMLLIPDDPSRSGTFFSMEKPLHLKPFDSEWITVAQDEPAPAE